LDYWIRIDAIFINRLNPARRDFISNSKIKVLSRLNPAAAGQARLNGHNRLNLQDGVTVMKSKTTVEEKALKRSMIGAFILAIWGVTMAWVSDSSAVMLDGMFNLISGIVSFFSIQVTRLVSGKETREFPLGYYAFESLILFIKGASILILLLMALYTSLEVMLSGGREPALGLMTIYVALAMTGCLILYGISKSSLKKSGSEILEAETSAWLVNAVVTGAIGIAFGVTLLIQQTAFGWIARYVDQILVIFLSILFVKEPLLFMKNGLSELLLAAPQVAFTKPYEEKLLSMKDELGARNMALEIMKTGQRMWVTVKFDPEDDAIQMNELMRLKEKLSAAAKEVYENTWTEVLLERT